MPDLACFDPDLSPGSTLAIGLIVVAFIAVLAIGLTDLSAWPSYSVLALGFGLSGLARHLAIRNRRVERRGMRLLDLDLDLDQAR